MFDGGLEHGNEVPVSPELYSPMSVDYMVVDFVEAFDPEVQPLHDLLESHEDLTAELVETHESIMSLVMKLGGGGEAYQRERARQVKRIVAEVYSSARVTHAAKLLPQYKLIPGLAVDLTGCDDEGRPWDFTDAGMRRKAEKMLDEQDPYMLVGSPPCTNFCA